MHVAVKSDPVIVRASAILEPAGAYDPDAKTLAVLMSDYSLAELRIQYTRGAPGGQAKFMVFVSNEEFGTYYPRSIDDASIHVTQPRSFSDLYQSEKLMPIPADALPMRITYMIDVATAMWIKVIFAEVGVIGAPGTVVADCILGGSQLA